MEFKRAKSCFTCIHREKCKNCNYNMFCDKFEFYKIKYKKINKVWSYYNIVHFSLVTIKDEKIVMKYDEFEKIDDREPIYKELKELIEKTEQQILKDKERKSWSLDTSKYTRSVIEGKEYGWSEDIQGDFDYF